MNGVSRYVPPLLGMLATSASPFNDRTLVADGIPLLRVLGVKYVVVRPFLYSNEDLGNASVEILEHHPEVARTHRYGRSWMFVLHTDRDEPMPPARLVPSSEFRAAASHEPARLAAAFDENPNTRWLSGGRQDGTESIVLRFNPPIAVARLEIVSSARSLGDYPRSLEVASVSADGAEHVLHNGQVLENLGLAIKASADLPVVVIPLPASDSTGSSGLVIRQRGRSNPWFWSVDELRVFER